MAARTFGAVRTADTRKNSQGWDPPSCVAHESGQESRTRTRAIGGRPKPYPKLARRTEPNVPNVRTDHARAKLTKLTVPRGFHRDAPAPNV